MTDTKTVEKIRIAIAHLVHVNEAAGELMQAFNERGESDCEWCGEDIGLDDHDADCKLGYLYDSMEIPTVVQGRDWPDILAELELLVKERDSAKSKLAALVEAAKYRPNPACPSCLGHGQVDLATNGIGNFVKARCTSCRLSWEEGLRRAAQGEP